MILNSKPTIFLAIALGLGAQSVYAQRPPSVMPQLPTVLSDCHLNGTLILAANKVIDCDNADFQMEPGSEIIANEFSLTIKANNARFGDPTLSDKSIGATIRTFGTVNINPQVPAVTSPPPDVPPGMNPELVFRPDRARVERDRGADGRSGFDGLPGNKGLPGFEGKSAGVFTLELKGESFGRLSVFQIGQNGGRGGQGSLGGRSGNGERGRPGNWNNVVDCPKPAGWGGLPGLGGHGGTGGDGNRPGNGGVVQITMKKSENFELSIAVVPGLPGRGGPGGEPGPLGDPGLGGPADGPNNVCKDESNTRSGDKRPEYAGVVTETSKRRGWNGNDSEAQGREGSVEIIVDGEKVDPTLFIMKAPGPLNLR